MTDDDDFENEVLDEIAQAVATLPKELQDLAAEHAPFVLHSAAAAGEVELVGALLDAGLSPDMYPGTDDEDDEPPLGWIARHRDQTMDTGLAVARLLIERGADVNEGLPLLTAAETKDVPLMSLLAAAGADASLALSDADEDAARLLGKFSGDTH